MAALTLIALAAVAVVLLSGDGGPEDETAIRDVITRTVTSSDPADCAAVYTQGMLDRSYFGTGAVALRDCEQTAGDAPPQTQPDAVAIDEVQIAGAQATAAAHLEGGVFNGATLTFETVTEGGAWKVNRVLDADLDHDSLDRLLRSELVGHDLGAEEIDCTVAKLEQSFATKDLERALVSGEDLGEPDSDAAARCLRAETLRQQLVDGWRKDARAREIPASVRQCVSHEFSALSAPVIRTLVGADDDRRHARIAALMRPCLEGEEARGDA